MTREVKVSAQVSLVELIASITRGDEQNKNKQTKQMSPLRKLNPCLTVQWIDRVLLPQSYKDTLDEPSHFLGSVTYAPLTSIGLVISNINYQRANSVPPLAWMWLTYTCLPLLSFPEFKHWKQPICTVTWQPGYILVDIYSATITLKLKYFVAPAN